MTDRFAEVYSDRRSSEHRTQVGTLEPDRSRRGAPVGWIASCSCGWEAEGDRGGMYRGLAAARQHERGMDAELEADGPDA